MDYTVITYLLYLTISVCLTVWVARTLFRNGAHFLIEAFGGDAKLAGSVNHLLVVGFYLINLGYITLNLKMKTEILNTQMTIEALSKQIGFVLLALGCMHFGNMYVFNRIRRRHALAALQPPVTPSAHLKDQHCDCEPHKTVPAAGTA